MNRWMPSLPQPAVLAAAAIALSAPLAAAQDCSLIRATRDALHEKPLTIDADETPIADFFSWFTASTGIDVQVVWIDDGSGSGSGLDAGIDRETPLSFSARQQPALVVLEAALEQASRKSFLGDEFEWQFNAAGHIEVGPKSVLNKNRRVEIYELADLIIEPTNHTDAPELDLNQALQSGQGGSGPPFTTNDEDPERRSTEEKLQELIDLIQIMVEPEQWEANGGDGAMLRPWRTSIIVNAPEYIHRALGRGFCSVPF